LDRYTIYDALYNSLEKNDVGNNLIDAFVYLEELDLLIKNKDQELSDINCIDKH
jgi:hypothetical protein